MHYLHDFQYYVDLYDLHTVEECLDYYWGIKNGMEKHREELSKDTSRDFDKEVHKGVSYMINALKGERYRHRAETINEWMDRDRKIQEYSDNSTPPKGITCKHCGSPMVNTIKDLQDAYSDHPKALFMYECIKCKKRRAIYDDGTEWVHEPEKCPSCHSPLKNRMTNKKNVLTTVYKCSRCSYTRKDVDDFNKMDKEQKARGERQNKLLAEYRKDFCLDDANGPEYIQSLDRMYRFVDEMKKQEEKKKDPIYQKAMSLKRISVVELEKLLSGTLEKEKFIKLTFDKPEMGRQVIIPFTVLEANTDRKPYDGTNLAKKVIKNALENTNWRLMSEGIYEKLGILTGRLKGVEGEDQLIELTKNS